MSFPAYPNYRDSGIEWLGAIPIDWQLSKFRHTFRESDEKIESEVVGPMLSVSGYRGIEIKDYDDENRRRSDEDLIGYRIVRPGQLVVNTMWLNYAGLGVSEHEGHVSPAYRAYQFADENADRRFVHHLMRSSAYVLAYTQLLTGIRPNSLQMSRADLMDFPIVLPPQPTQRAIAAFLDRETAKIDRLIEEQRRLIALLKEKRQAVISHAVTKGLNPDAPIKDSGIEWLGEVPAHWSVAKGSVIGKLFSSEQVPESAVSEEGLVPFLKVASLSADSMSIREWKWFVGDIYESTNLSSLYVVFPKRGAAIFGNKVNVADRTSLIDPNLMGWKMYDSADTFYIAYSLKARRISDLADVSTVPQINNKHIAPERFPLPPLTEQREIVQFLDHALVGYDSLAGEAQSAVNLLQERRAALISAAVTGKIDVRDAAAAEDREAA